jgi:hypothetical protein
MTQLTYLSCVVDVDHELKAALKSALKAEEENGSGQLRGLVASALQAMIPHGE